MKMKQVNAIVNGEDPSAVDLNRKERKLKLTTSSNIGSLGKMNKNSKTAELEKMIKENKKLANTLN
jgi:hypothetical protein